MPKKCWVYRNRRANIEVTFQLPDGQKIAKTLIADTGAPLEFVLSTEDLDQLKFKNTGRLPAAVWGELNGGVVKVSMSEPLKATNRH